MTGHCRWLTDKSSDMFEEEEVPQEPQSQNVAEEFQGDISRLRKSAIKFFKSLISLTPGLDREGTIDRIQENKQMLGANAWLLMCSIMVASLGLDLNSPAVIIGAMLISPLMSPILGIGLGIATNDRGTFIASSRHFTIAIAIALITSTLYFLFTPFGNVTDEILSRTEPTFLDVLVASFGGIAGIISISRKDQSNALPGVAIATALMPPLCVTGFGIAKSIKALFGFGLEADFTISPFITNSFYLFFLNSFFVALATFIIVRLLKFPLKKYADKKTRRNTMSLIVFCSFIMILPSFFLLRSVLKKVNLERQKNEFISTYLKDKAKYLDNSKILTVDGKSTLLLKVYGTAINMQDSAYYLEGLRAIGFENTDIEIIPTSEIDLSSFKMLQSEIDHVSAALEAIPDPQEKEVKPAGEDFQDLLDDIKISFDSIDQITFAPTAIRADSAMNSMVLIRWSENKDTVQKKIDEEKIKLLFGRRKLATDVEIISNF